MNKRGKRAAAAMARHLDAEGRRPALVLCSAARRTRETLDILLETLGPKVSVHIEPDLYLADVPTLLARVQRVPADVPSVLVLAHNPGLQELALELAEAAGHEAAPLRERVERKFPTTALARFWLRLEAWSELSGERLAGAVKFLDYVTPADLGDA